MKAFIIFFLFLILLVLSSCSEKQINRPEELMVDKNEFVTSSEDGIIYWKDGNSKTLVAGEWLSCPKFSPNKKWVVYCHPVEGGYKLNVIKTNGDSLHSLANGRIFSEISQPTWSPKGNKILYSDIFSIVLISFPSDLTEEYTVNHQRLTDKSATWNHNGEKVFFASAYRTDYPWNLALYILDVNSKSIDTLFKSDVIHMRYLTCSADDENLAYYSYVPEDSILTWNVFIFNISSKNVSHASITKGGENLYPAWSPTNPDLLVYSGGESSTAYPRLLILYDNKSKTRKALTTSAYEPSDKPVWSDDGVDVVFIKSINNNGYRININTNQITQLNITGYDIDW